MTRDERLLRAGVTDESALAAGLARLAAGEPLAHILGEWDFYDLTLRVTADTLIPRPETEHLVEYAIKHLPHGARFLDLCTGSGCVAITVLAHRPDTTAVAVDLSTAALGIARENATRIGVLERITLQHADILTEKQDVASFDAILSNPPYIASAVVDTLDVSLSYEPRMALDGGADGLCFYRAIRDVQQAAVRPGGFLAMEIGYDQAAAMRDLFAGVEILKDYSGNDRVAVVKIPD